MIKNTNSLAALPFIPLKRIVALSLLFAFGVTMLTGCGEKAPVSVSYQGEDMEGPAMLKIRNISGAPLTIDTVRVNGGWIAKSWILRDENSDVGSLLTEAFSGGRSFPARLEPNHVAIVIVNTRATVGDAYEATISTEDGLWSFEF